MPRKSRRSVYDPTIGVGMDDTGTGGHHHRSREFSAERTGVFDRDPLAMQPSDLEEDIRCMSDHVDLRDPIMSQIDGSSSNAITNSDDKGRRIRWKVLAGVVSVGLLTIIIVGTSGGGGKSDNTSSSTVSAAAFVPPVSNLGDVCSESHLRTIGSEQCQEACAPGNCCNFAANLPLSCLSGNEQGCRDYHLACWVLDADIQVQTAHHNLPEAPTAQLELACNDVSLATANGLNQCASLCQPAKCCFEGIGNDNSVSCANTDACVGYAACMRLKAVSHQHSDIPRLVNDKCSQHNDLKATMECENVCSQALCCFLPEEDCNLGTGQNVRDFCTQYTACADVLQETIQQHLLDDAYDLTPKDTVPMPPLNLGETCELSKLNTKSGRADCQDACSPADCCVIDPVEFPAVSCYNSDQNACDAYAVHCKNLATAMQSNPIPQDVSSQSRLEMPPMNLQQLCAPDKLQQRSARAQCEDACSPADCCTVDPVEFPHVSCYHTDENACDAYITHCQKLHVDGTPGSIGFDQQQLLPAPPTDLAQLCSPTQVGTTLGRAQCEDACRPSDCCSIDPVFQDKSCQTAVNENICNSYAAHCQILAQSAANGSANAAGSTTGPYLPPVPSDIDATCDILDINMSATDRAKCENVCKAAECCKIDPMFADASCNREENHELCHEWHKHCWVLQDNISHVAQDQRPSQTQEQAPSLQDKYNLKLTCRESNLRTPNGMQACEELCEPYACCWKDGVDSCADDAMCPHVVSCMVLSAINNLPRPDPFLSAHCSATNIQSVMGRAECEDGCRPAACCDYDTSRADSCLDGNHDTCQEYHSYCWILQDNASKHDQTPASVVAAANDSADQDEVAHVCRLDHLVTQSGIQDCLNTCNPVECCWKPGVQSCAHDPVCQEFSECYVLRTVKYEDGPRPEPTSSSNGGSSHQEVIDTLYELVPPPNNLESLCSVSNSVNQNLDACENACAKAKCCELGFEDDRSCLDGNQHICQRYHEYCWILNDKLTRMPENPDFAPAPSDIDYQCSVENLQAGSGYDRCWASCMPALCCFVDHGETCAWNQRCMQYSMCQTLFYAGFDDPILSAPSNPVSLAPPSNPAPSTQQGGNSGPTKAEIDDACSLIVLDQCEVLCSPAACCADSNCGFSSTIDCSKYASCEILY